MNPLHIADIAFPQSPAEFSLNTTATFVEYKMTLIISFQEIE